MAIQALEIGDARVGRDGFLRLAFERRGARTVLTERDGRIFLEMLEKDERPAPALVRAVKRSGRNG